MLDSRTAEPVQGATVSLHKASKPKPQPSGPGTTLEFSMSTVDDEMEERLRDFSSRGKTDSMGRVQLTSLAGPGRIRVKHEDFAPLLTEEIGFSVEARTEELSIGRGGTVVIEAVDAAGSPLAGIRIEHKAPDDVPLALDEMTFGDRDTTDAEGRLVFEHLSLGEHRFRVQKGPRNGFFASEGGGAVVRMRSSVVTQGAGTTEPQWSTAFVTEGGREIVQIVGKPQCELAGRITENGAALPGAEIELRAKTSGPAAGIPGFGGGGGMKDKTSGEGGYSLSDVEIGEYELVVRHPSRRGNRAPLRHRLPSG